MPLESVFNQVEHIFYVCSKFSWLSWASRIFPYIIFFKCSWNFIRLPNMYKFIWEWIGTFVMYQEFPGGSDSKESSCNMGDLGLIPGLGRSPAEGHGNPLLYSCLENLQGQRGLAGYSPWSSKESDMTEWLSTHNI